MQELSTFKFWCQKVMPLVYDESLSYYEVLCKVVDALNKIIGGSGSLISQVNLNTADIATLKQELSIVQIELEKVKNGDYVPLYLDSLSKWIDENLQEMVGKIVKYVIFGLSNEGYFTAYIPESWDFMKFDTIVDPDNEFFGHLIMRW